MEVKNTKKRKRDTSEIINNRGRLMAVQIQMYWLTLRMQERMTIDICILLKLIFKPSSEITAEHQRIVEPIFGELKVEEDIILLEKHSSSDESDEYQSRGNKKPKA